MQLRQTDDGGVEQHVGGTAGSAGDARVTGLELGMEAAAVEGSEGAGQGIDQCADGGADDVLSAVIVAGVTRAQRSSRLPAKIIIMVFPPPLPDLRTCLFLE